MLLVLLMAQAASPIDPWWNVVQTGGVVGVLFLGIALLITGRLASRRELDEIRKDRDFWRDVALKGTDLTDRHVSMTDDVLRERGDLLEARITRQLAGIEASVKAIGGQGV